MAIGAVKQSGFDFDTFNKSIRIEQVIRYFGIKIESNHKILCFNHKEKIPSCHVNEDYVYCFACQQGWGAFDLAHHLREQRDKTTYTVPEMIIWLGTTTFPAPSKAHYSAGESRYLGDVPLALIDYWQSQLTATKVEQLRDERLFTEMTIRQYKLGWRPDYNAWTIPFWRGVPGTGGAEIIQFRMTAPDAKSKYLGLAGHQRGAVMNQHLLETPQDYLVILFGAFDGILALQDGLLACSLNGCMPFRKDEKERVQKLFEKQHTIFIVPDNTAAEFKAAYALAEWLNAEVRFFPPELPEGTDYIDYRKQGFSMEDFKQYVLGIEPAAAVNPVLLENVTEYLKVGDPKHFASVHVQMMGSQNSPVDIAREVAKIGPIGILDSEVWYPLRKNLWKVTDLPSLVSVLDNVAPLMDVLKGTW